MMQSCTALFMADLGGIRCVRTWYVIFILLLFSEDLNDESFHSSAQRGSSPHCINVLAASSLSQAPQQVNVEDAAAVGSAPPKHERKSKLHLHSFTKNKLHGSERSSAEQRSAAGFSRVSNGRQSTASVIRPAVRISFGSRRRSISLAVQSAEREKASEKPASNSIFLPVPAGRGSFTPSVSYAPLKQNDRPSKFVQFSGYTYTLTASEPSFKSVPLLSLPENIELRARPHVEALHTYLSDGKFLHDRLASSISLSPPSALKRASGVEMDPSSSATEKEMHKYSTSTSVTPACTHGPRKQNFSSFLHLTSSSEAVLPWSSTTIPSACRYAGCEAGTFRGRDVSDDQSCFAFSHCSRCPLYPLERVEYCSKLKEESNYLLLMQSTLHLMPEPELPFHYRPSNGAKAGMKSERFEADKSRGVDEPGEGAPSERGSEDWSGGEGGGDDDAESSLLHVGSRAAFPVHPSQLRHVPASLRKPRRDKGNAGLTYQASDSTKAKQSIAIGKFTVSSLLEDAETMPNAGRETPNFAVGESDLWTEREVQLGEWKSHEAHEEVVEEGENTNVPQTGQASETPLAELLKFQQSRTFRVKQAEMRSHLSECAISTKGVIRLLLMFAFQPTRAKMSVQSARQRLGLFTTTASVQPAESFEREEQPWEEAEQWTGEERPVLDDHPPSAYAEQHSSLGEPEDNQLHSSPVQLSPPSPPYSQDEGPILRNSHSIHVERDRRPSFTRQSDSTPSKSCSAGIKSDAISSSDAVFARAWGGSHLSQQTEPASLLQTPNDTTQEGDAEDDAAESAIKFSALRRFTSRVKGLFRSGKKKDKEFEEPERPYEQEEEGEDADELAAKTAKAGGKAKDSKTKRLFRKVFKQKTPEQKRERREKKKATAVLVHAPKVHLEIAVVSPAVRKCRKPLEWSGRLRLSTMLHVQYFVTAREDEIQDQVPAFINNALRIVMRCESKEGCIINRDLQSCVLVSCVKHKRVSREAIAASAKAAEALARSQLKLAQSGTRGILSEEERATRAAAFEKNIEEKQHEAEARQLQQYQQILSGQEQQQIIHQQLAKFSTAIPDTMQRRLLELIGAEKLEIFPVDVTAPPLIREAQQPIESASLNPQGSQKWLTPATVAAVSVGSAAGLLGVGIVVYWRCFR